MNPAVVRTEPEVVDLGSFLRLIDLYTVTDPDPGASTIRVQVRDNFNGKGNFVVGSNVLAANTWHEFSVDQARNVRYNAAGTFARETFSVRVLGDDGLWSNTAFGTITSGNSRPVLTATDGRVRANEYLNVAGLVSLFDTDNDTGQLYRIVDRKIGANGGRLVLGDTILAQGQWHLMSGAEFSTLRYEGANQGRDEERLTVEAYDGFSWSDQVDFNIATTQETQITGVTQNVLINERVPASSLFQANDADGDEWQSGYFVDRRPNVDGGYWEYQGTRMPSAQWFQIPRANFDQLFYVGGDTGPQRENIGVQLYDGFEFSTVVDIPVDTVVPPEVFGLDSEVQARQYLNIGTGGVSNTQGAKAPGTPILTYGDADGDLVTELMLVERSFNSNGGHFVFKGNRLPPATWFRIDVNELDELEYRGGEFGRQDERIGVRAFANGVWSDVSEFNIGSLENLHAPELNVISSQSRTGSVFSLESMFTWSDADNDLAETIRLYDTGDNPAGNYFTVNGVRQPAKQWIQLDFSQVGDVQYHFSNQANEELFRMTISDHRFTSTLQTARMEAVGVPVLNAPENDITVDSIERVPARTILERLDAGPPAIQYQVYDENTASISGRFELDGVDLQQGVMHTLTAAEFDRLVVKGAEADFGRQLDPMLFRADNGVTGWSEWERINVNTDPIGPRALESGTQWTDFSAGPGEPVTLTYQFLDGNTPQTAAAWPQPYRCTPLDDPDDECNTAGEMQALNNSQRQAIRESFRYIESVANVRFVEELYDSTLADSTMLIGAADLPGGVGAWAYLPSGDVTTGISAKPGDVWFARASFDADTNFNTGLGSPFRFTALHEFGHTLGFSHPFEPNLPLSIFLDFDYNTVMSYTHDNVHNPFPGYPEQPSTLMLYDIMQAQNLYGANMNHNTDNNHYGNNFSGSYPHFVDNNEQHQTTLWDAGGFDTLNYSRHVANETIDLRAGTWSSVNGVQQTLRIQYGTQIENARGGSGNDNIRGNEVANLIWGNQGNDVLRGGGDNDVLRGGIGDDTYIWSLGDGRDSIREEGLGGTETIQILDPSGSVTSLEDDFVARVFNNTLRIDITLNQGEGQGTISIENFDDAESAVELMTIHNRFGAQIGNTIDLFSIYSAATTQPQRFMVTDTPAENGLGGFIAVPVV